MDAYSQLSAQAQEIVDTARVAIQDSCLLGEGITMPLISEYIQGIKAHSAAVASVGAKLNLPPAGDFAGGALGIDDSALARQYGYKDPWNTVEQTVAEEGSVTPSSFPSSVYADTQTKCIESGDGLPSTFGNLGPQGSDLPSMLVARALSQTAANPSVVNAEAAWSACMKGMGFEYGTPTGPGSPESVYGSEDTATQPATPTETATAVADVECKQQTRVEAVFVGIENGYDNALAQQNATELATYKQDLAKRVSGAEQILGEPRYKGFLGLAQQQVAATVGSLPGQ